jgi:hypothetical protein
LSNISDSVLPLEIVSLCSREAGAGLIVAGAGASGARRASGAASGRKIKRINRAAITEKKERMKRRVRFLRPGSFLAVNRTPRLPL